MIAKTAASKCLLFLPRMSKIGVELAGCVGVSCLPSRRTRNSRTSRDRNPSFSVGTSGQATDSVCFSHPRGGAKADAGLTESKCGDQKDVDPKL